MLKVLVSFLVMAGGATAKCCTNWDCQPPNPICQPDGTCSNKRVVEPISRLPKKFMKELSTKLDNKLWTGVKWVRAAIPVVGMDKNVNDAALMEVAYFVDNLLYTNGSPQGNSDLAPGLLKDSFATIIQVFPRCPYGWTQWGANNVAIGGATTFHTRVNEEWVMRYPKCAMNIGCSSVAQATFCTQCGNKIAGPGQACNDTLAHEFGHTLGMAYGKIKGGRDFVKEIWGSIANAAEYPAWAASQWFQNPQDEGAKKGRSRGNPMDTKDFNYYQNTLGFKKLSPWNYVLKHRRCPAAGLKNACPDSLVRSYRVLLDNEGLHPANSQSCMSAYNPNAPVVSRAELGITDDEPEELIAAAENYFGPDYELEDPNTWVADSAGRLQAWGFGFACLVSFVFQF